MNLQTLIFIGRSGCGKGTQIAKVETYLKENSSDPFFHLEAGNRFRNFIKENHYASELATEINELGALQPEFLSVWAWGGELIENLNKNTHLVVDGTPRRVVEAKTLESALGFYKRDNVQIVYVNVSRDWAFQRMIERGRHDDEETEDINMRLDWFESDVVPVIDYYRAHKSHTFHEINGEQSIDEVYQDVLKSLDI